MAINPYEKKKNPGVRGSVPTDFDSIKIYDRAGESIVIYVGRLEKGAYDYGMEIHLPDNTHIRRLPGIGKGWFSNYHDANAYAAFAIKIGFSSRLSNAARIALQNHISNVVTPKLNLCYDD